MRVFILSVLAAVALAGLACASLLSVCPVEDLERTLADWRLGCGGCPARWGWDALQLARFAAGRLTGLGFQCELARSGDAWWVLVRLLSETGETVVPVLPGLPPLDREGQFTRGVFLGRVPWLGQGQPDPRYLAPEEVLALPSNVPPVVRVRVDPAEAQAGEEVRFVAEVRDPDGYIVLLAWNFGDGDGSWAQGPHHVYDREGMYVVTLTAVDNAGGACEAQLVVVVRAPQTPLPGATPPPGGGCGCGR